MIVVNNRNMTKSKNLEKNKRTFKEALLNNIEPDNKETKSKNSHVSMKKLQWTN